MMIRGENSKNLRPSTRQRAAGATVLTRWLLVLLAGFRLAFGLVARAADAPEEQAAFRELGWDKQTIMIPMRDGVRLRTEILRPLAASEPLPFLLRRTPYDATIVATNFARSLTNSLKELVADGYVFVQQDIRGKFRSEGQFVMMRPPRRPGHEAFDESTDTFDTIEWLVRNVAGNNGRAGIYGTSYLGWTTLMGTLDPHPALRAASEEASPADMFLGDDFHHNGAFRLSYGYEYAYALETARTNVDVKLDRYDAYESYLRLGSLANVNRRWLHGTIPTWNDYIAHPNYDAFWQRQAVAGYLTKVTVPVLHVAGWWDQEDFYGPQKAYEALERHDAGGNNFFVAGPWNHGGWNGGEGRKLGNVDFGTPTGQFFREQIRARWFAMHLKDRSPTNFPEAITFQTGANQWESHSTWPPREGIRRRALYFLADGRLGFTAPTTAGRGDADRYVSDPAHPVPYRTRPVETTYGPGSRWSTWLVEDQRHVHNRPDVLSYETPQLDEDVVVTGEVFANLFASTTGTDADWVVKLIDVHPQSYPADPALGGYQLMVANEVFRGRFRQSFERPASIPSGRVLPYRFSLHGMNHRFRKGHKIMVQVQSTWFPLIDRNPQRYVPNIFEAGDTDFRAATHSVHRSRRFPSHLDLPVREQAGD